MGDAAAMEQLQQLEQQQLEQQQQQQQLSGGQGLPNSQRRQVEMLLQQLHSQLPEAGAAGPMARVPGADLFEGRLAKCTAVPPEQRSADEAAFLTSHAVMEEAAAVLVPMVAEGVQPDERTRTAALLQWVSGQLALVPGQPVGLPHAQMSSFDFQNRVMRPLLEVRTVGDALATRHSLQLEALLAGGQPVRSLERVVQLIMLVRMRTSMSLDQESIPVLRSMCNLLSRSLRDPEVAADLEAQLAELQRHAAAKGSAWRVPPLAKLRAAAAMVYCDVCQAEARAAGQSQDVLRRCVAAARWFTEEDGAQPRSWHYMGGALQQRAILLANTGEGEDILQAWMRGLEVARAAGSDVWTARLAFQIAEISIKSPSVTPRQAMALVEEGEAALGRAKRNLPFDWLQSAMSRRENLRANMLPTLRLFHAKAPDRWDPALLRRLMPSQLLGPPEVLARSICSGCQRFSMALSVCSGCKKAKYCSRECQKAAWAGHKAECKAAQAARQEGTAARAQGAKQAGGATQVVRREGGAGQSRHGRGSRRS